MFTAVGIAFAWGASSYTIGTGARMGPGYFPLMLGVVLAALGLFILFKSLVVETADGSKVGQIAWRPLLCVIGANLLFGALLAGLPSLKIPAFGMVVAIFGLVLVASIAAESYKIKEVLVLATVLAAGSYLAFVMLLKLQFPVWPALITG